jgi:hypothetical protein
MNDEGCPSVGERSWLSLAQVQIQRRHGFVKQALERGVCAPQPRVVCSERKGKAHLSHSLGKQVSDFEPGSARHVLGDGCASSSNRLKRRTAPRHTTSITHLKRRFVAERSSHVPVDQHATRVLRRG